MLWLSTGGDDVITVEGESGAAEEGVSGGKEVGVAEEGVSGGGKEGDVWGEGVSGGPSKEGHPRQSLGEESTNRQQRPGGSSSGDSGSPGSLFPRQELHHMYGGAKDGISGIFPRLPMSQACSSLWFPQRECCWSLAPPSLSLAWYGEGTTGADDSLFIAHRHASHSRLSRWDRKGRIQNAARV